MANLNDHASRFRKGLGSPFAAGNDLEWCPRCRMAVDHETQAEHQGTSYGWKRWCLRCGKVLSYGVFENVPLLSGGVALPAAALEWVMAPGQDRR